MPASDDEIDVLFAGSACVGGVIGAFVGLGLGIWALVEYVEPAFDATHGINDKGAKALTAVVGLAGGLEATGSAGFFGGFIATPLLGAALVAMLACCFQVGKVASSCCQPRASANRSTMLYAGPGAGVQARAVEYVVRADAVVVDIETAHAVSLV